MLSPKLNMPLRKKRKWKTEWVRHGKYQGYRRADVQDATWALGYELPQLFEKHGATLKELALYRISRSRINISQLPKPLIMMVNNFHHRFTIGVVTNQWHFRMTCFIHEHQWMGGCRQCRLRREAWELHTQRMENADLHRGLLTDRWWEGPAGRIEVANAMRNMRARGREKLDRIQEARKQARELYVDLVTSRATFAEQERELRTQFEELVDRMEGLGN